MLNLEKIIKNGGATLSNKTLKNLNFKSGYSVSICDGGIASLSSKSDIEKLVFKTQKQAQKLGGNVGIWVDNNLVYVDISKNILSKDKAILLGKKNKQLAIFDNEKKESIYLD